MSTYKIKLGQLLYYRPAQYPLFFLICGTIALVMLLFDYKHMQMHMHTQMYMHPISLLLPWLIYFGLLYAVLRTPFAVSSANGNTLVLRSLTQTLSINISDITSFTSGDTLVLRALVQQRLGINIGSITSLLSPRRSNSDRKGLLLIGVRWGEKRTGFLITREDTDAFLKEITAINPRIQAIGFAPQVDMPTVEATETPMVVDERTFTINAAAVRGRSVTSIIISLFFFPGSLAMTGGGLVLAFRGPFIMEKLLAGLGITLLGVLFLATVVRLLLQDLRIPTAIQQHADGTFTFESSVQTLTIASQQIHSIRKRRGGWAYLNYQQNGKSRTIGFLVSVMPEFEEFVATIRNLQPNLTTSGMK